MKSGNRDWGPKSVCPAKIGTGRQACIHQSRCDNWLTEDIYKPSPPCISGDLGLADILKEFRKRAEGSWNEVEWAKEDKQKASEVDEHCYLSLFIKEPKCRSQK